MVLHVQCAISLWWLRISPARLCRRPLVKRPPDSCGFRGALRKNFNVFGVASRRVTAAESTKKEAH